MAGAIDRLVKEYGIPVHKSERCQAIFQANADEQDEQQKERAIQACQKQYGTLDEFFTRQLSTRYMLDEKAQRAWIAEEIAAMMPTENASNESNDGNGNGNDVRQEADTTVRAAPWV